LTNISVPYDLRPGHFAEFRTWPGQFLHVGDVPLLFFGKQTVKDIGRYADAVHFHAEPVSPGWPSAWRKDHPESRP
jgi:hypothetical protein